MAECLQFAIFRRSGFCGRAVLAGISGEKSQLSVVLTVGGEFNVWCFRPCGTRTGKPVAV